MNAENFVTFWGSGVNTLILLGIAILVVYLSSKRQTGSSRSH